MKKSFILLAMITLALNFNYGSIAAQGNIPQVKAKEPRYLYVANAGEATISISIFSINSATGQLTPIKDMNIGEFPSSIAVDSSGKYLYALLNGSNNILVYTIDQMSGNLIERKKTINQGMPQSITIDSSSQFLYSANRNPDTVSIYSINQANGELAEIKTIEAGKSPSSIIVDPLNRFIYVINRDSKDIVIYSIEQLTLNKRKVLTVGHIPYSIMVDPRGRLLYMTYLDFTEIATYRIDQTTGVLVKGKALKIEKSPESFTIDPPGKFIYAVYLASNDIKAYQIDQNSGELTIGKKVPAYNQPSFVTVDPSGRFLYITNTGLPVDDSVSLHHIDQKTGALTAEKQRIETGRAPSCIAIAAYEPTQGGTTANQKPKASFDCSKATTSTEKAICSSETLASLDRQLSESYKAAIKKYKDAGNADVLKKLETEQKEWLKKRNACGSDAVCLEKIMNERLEILKKINNP